MGSDDKAGFAPRPHRVTLADKVCSVASPPSQSARQPATRAANFLGMDLSEADFTDTDLTGSTIQSCILGKTNFARAKGAFFDPQHNTVKGARVALETALLLVQSFGIVVEEFERG